jgi:hypothetical protein
MLALTIDTSPSLAYEIGYWLGAFMHYVGVAAGLLLLGRRLKNLMPN